MLYPLIPKATPLEPFAWIEGVFSDQEIDDLRARAAAATAPALVGGDNAINPEIRRSDVTWLNPSQENAWIFERLSHAAADLNAQFYRFDLAGFGEPLQLTNYKQDNHGMYGWHQDFNANISRKLSLVVQLTDPSEYEGGNLEIANGSSPVTVRKQKGLVVAFPAFNLHQVTPVVRGTRQSLVAWVSGPAFR